MGIGTRGLEDRAESWTSNASTPRSCSSARSRCSRRPSRPTARVLVDATLGMGGHSRAFLERFPNLTVIGLDRDPTRSRSPANDSRRSGTARASCTPCTTASRGPCAPRDSPRCRACCSTSASRRCSSTAPSADSRTRRTRRSTCAWTSRAAAPPRDVIAESSEDELRRIFHDFGEEKLAARYARAIVRARAEAPITRSAELVAIITAATPVAVQRQGHPAKRVFQALRIEVNEELSVLAARDARRARHHRRRRADRRARLPVARGPDRQARAPGARRARRLPRGLPMELPEHRPQFRLLVRGAELASESEQAENPRAKPVRLRAAERLRRPS